MIKRTPVDFVAMLKLLNCYCDVSVNNNTLTTREQLENMDRIKAISSIQLGYDVSACDPVFILVCQLYNIDITHKWGDIVIKYKYLGKTVDSIILQSNTSHCWY